MGPGSEFFGLLLFSMFSGVGLSRTFFSLIESLAEAPAQKGPRPRRSGG